MKEDRKRWRERRRRRRRSDRKKGSEYEWSREICHTKGTAVCVPDN